MPPVRHSPIHRRAVDPNRVDVHFDAGLPLCPLTVLILQTLKTFLRDGSNDGSCIDMS